jgi:hypothetical protein
VHATLAGGTEVLAHQPRAPPASVEGDDSLNVQDNRAPVVVVVWLHPTGQQIVVAGLGELEAQASGFAVPAGVAKSHQA